MYIVKVYDVKNKWNYTLSRLYIYIVCVRLQKAFHPATSRNWQLTELIQCGGSARVGMIFIASGREHRQRQNTPRGEGKRERDWWWIVVQSQRGSLSHSSSLLPTSINELSILILNSLIIKIFPFYFTSSQSINKLLYLYNLFKS